MSEAEIGHAVATLSDKEYPGDDPSVTIVIVAWNAADDIGETLATILQQDYANFDIIVVDNASTDDTVDIVRSDYPSVQIYALNQNLGYRRSNRIGMQAATGEYVLLCNDDIHAEPGWLRALVDALRADESVGIVTPLIMSYFEPQLISAAGNALHYTAMVGHSHARNHPMAYARRMDPNVPAVSGCCFMIRRALMEELGGFSTDFDRLDTGWHAAAEDADLSWRAWLAGYRVQLVPNSVIYHKHDGRRPVTPPKFATVEWARQLMLLRNYEARTLWFMMPLLVLLELSSWGYALLKGRVWVEAKAEVWRWLLTHPHELRAMRTAIQAQRTVPDSKLLDVLDITIHRSRVIGYGPVGRVIDSGLNWIFVLYHRFLRFMIST